MTGINGSSEYATAAAFRRALEDRLKAGPRIPAARSRNSAASSSSSASSPWSSRTPDRRGSSKEEQDFSCVCPKPGSQKTSTCSAAAVSTQPRPIAELRELTAPRDGDHLEFTIDGPLASGQDNHLAQARVTAYIGSTYGSFPVDLALDLKLVSTLETVRPTPVVNVPGLGPIPEFVLYPLADQVADKVCAMYELHGRQGTVSTRYRDLTDLALIITTRNLNATHLRSALELERHRRKMEPPHKLERPGPNWPAGYAAIARREKAARKFRDITTALALVSACLNPILSGERTTGTWDPSDGWANREHPTTQ